MIKYVKCLLTYQFINYTYINYTDITSLYPQWEKKQNGLKAVSKYLLKNQEHTSRTSKGLISPVFNLYLLSVCSPKGIPKNLLPRILTVKPNSFQPEQTPEKCLEINVWKCLFFFFGYHINSVVLLAFITWGAGCQMSCNASPHKEEPRWETMDSSPLQVQS